ncbi:MAG: tetratricopeptide repeat protein [Acidobacteriota bacterium]
MTLLDPTETLRFGNFELDVGAYELRRHDRRVRLERKPMELLMLLLERRQQLVARAEIVERLWGKDVFVDVERGVNTVVRKIRLALRDSRDVPMYVETVSGKGYRFIAPVDVIAGWLGRRWPVRMAVLPFETLSNEEELEYLADGLTEEVIASLGQIDPGHLRVIGRTSIRSYKKTSKPLTIIGAELAVDFLLEGVIRGEQGRLRITTKLIRVRDQVQAWSGSYDRQAASVLGLQQDVSTAIADQIKLRLSPERLTMLWRRQTPVPEAYELYLRGRLFWHHLTAPTTRRAIEYFTRATEIDPDYALAWAGIAEAFASSAINGDARPSDVWWRARDAAAQALRAQSEIAEVQHVFGQVNWFFEWDWPAAESAFRRAVALDPSFAWSHSMLGHVLSQCGRHEEAERVMRCARDLEPLSVLHYAMSSQVAFQAGAHDTALDYARQAVVIDPEFWVGYMMRGQAYEQAGDPERALEVLAIAVRLSGGNSKPISLRGYVLAKHGRLEEAREVLRALEELSHQRYVPPYAMALIHAGFDEPDAAFDWLERAHAAHDVHLVFLPVDSKWDRFREHPRLQALLERCNFTRTIGTPRRSYRLTDGPHWSSSG